MWKLTKRYFATFKNSVANASMGTKATIFSALVAIGYYSGILNYFALGNLLSAAGVSQSITSIVLAATLPCVVVGSMLCCLMALCCGFSMLQCVRVGSSSNSERQALLAENANSDAASHPHENSHTYGTVFRALGVIAEHVGVSPEEREKLGFDVESGNGAIPVGRPLTLSEAVGALVEHFMPGQVSVEDPSSIQRKMR